MMRIRDKAGLRATEAGATLIVALIFMLVFAGIAAAVFRSSLTSVQAIGNMQWRAEAIVAANDAIDEMLSSSDFAMRTSDLVQRVEASPYRWDLNGDGIESDEDIIKVIFPNVTLDGVTRKGPRCVRVQPITNASLDPGNFADVPCISSSALTGTAIGRATDAGGTAAAESSLSVCSNSEWSIRLRATDEVANTSIDVTQGVGLRMRTETVPPC